MPPSTTQNPKKVRDQRDRKSREFLGTHNWNYYLFLQVSLSVMVQLVTAAVAAGSNQVELKLVPRCTQNCCQRPIEAPLSTKPDTSLLYVDICP